MESPAKVLQIDADGCRATEKGDQGITNQRLKNETVTIRGEGPKEKIHYMEEQMPDTKRASGP